MKEVSSFCTVPVFLTLSFNIECYYGKKKKIRLQKRVAPPIISSSQQTYIQCLIISKFKSWSPSNPYYLSRNQWILPSGLQEISFSFITIESQKASSNLEREKTISIQLCQGSFLSLTFFPLPLHICIIFREQYSEMIDMGGQVASCISFH